MLSDSFKSAFKSALKSVFELRGKVSASSSNFGDVCPVALTVSRCQSLLLLLLSSSRPSPASVDTSPAYISIQALLLLLLTKWLFTSQKRLSGPTHRIFEVARPGPARSIIFSKFSARSGPARPITIFRSAWPGSAWTTGP